MRLFVQYRIAKSDRYPSEVVSPRTSEGDDATRKAIKWMNKENSKLLFHSKDYINEDLRPYSTGGNGSQFVPSWNEFYVTGIIDEIVNSCLVQKDVIGPVLYVLAKIELPCSDESDDYENHIEQGFVPFETRDICCF